MSSDPRGSTGSDEILTSIDDRRSVAFSNFNISNFLLNLNYLEPK